MIRILLPALFLVLAANHSDAQSPDSGTYLLTLSASASPIIRFDTQHIRDATRALEAEAAKLPKLAPSEDKAFKLALDYADKREPLLDCRRRAPEIAYLPDRAAWSVTLWGLPIGDSGYAAHRCSIVSFTVIVHSDGSVSERYFGMRCSW